MPQNSRDHKDYTTPYDDDPELNARQRAILRWRHGPNGIGQVRRPLFEAWKPTRRLEEKLIKIRHWMRKSAVGKNYLERLFAELEKHLLAAQYAVRDSQPVWCCEGVERGGAKDCPACLGQRIAPRGVRRRVYGR